MNDQFEIDTNPNYIDPVLCFSDGVRLYFTTREIRDQKGLDWETPINNLLNEGVNWTSPAPVPCDKFPIFKIILRFSSDKYYLEYLPYVLREDYPVVNETIYSLNEERSIPWVSVKNIKDDSYKLDIFPNTSLGSLIKEIKKIRGNIYIDCEDVPKLAKLKKGKKSCFTSDPFSPFYSVKVNSLEELKKARNIEIKFLGRLNAIDKYKGK